MHETLREIEKTLMKDHIANQFSNLEMQIQTARQSTEKFHQSQAIEEVTTFLHVAGAEETIRSFKDDFDWKVDDAYQNFKCLGERFEQTVASELIRCRKKITRLKTFAVRLTCNDDIVKLLEQLESFEYLFQSMRMRIWGAASKELFDDQEEFLHIIEQPIFIAMMVQKESSKKIIEGK